MSSRSPRPEPPITPTSYTTSWDLTATPPQRRERVCAGAMGARWVRGVSRVRTDRPGFLPAQAPKRATGLEPATSSLEDGAETQTAPGDSRGLGPADGLSRVALSKIQRSREQLLRIVAMCRGQGEHSWRPRATPSGNSSSRSVGAARSSRSPADRWPSQFRPAPNQPRPQRPEAGHLARFARSTALGLTHRAEGAVSRCVGQSWASYGPVNTRF
jgi:hypothetical protein